MAEKLKDKLFLPADVHRFADGLAAAWPDLDRERLIDLVLDGAWEERELKQRMRHLAACLGEVLPGYPRALEILQDVADQTGGVFGIVLSEFVQVHGVDDPGRSLPALQYFTRFGSAEFAVRPFLERNPEGTLAVMLQWTTDDNEYVRRSVANNLNDISKDHPEVVLEIGERWLGTSPRTDKIVKHACRTMLKAGQPRAMRLFGFADPAELRVEGLRLRPGSSPIGG